MSTTAVRPSSLQPSRNDNVVSGLLAGAVGTLVGYPLDTIKSHLQSSAAQHGGAQPSIMRSASAVYARAGIHGFYSGVAAPLVALAATSSINFGAYMSFRGLLGGSATSVAQGRSADKYTPAAGALVGPVLAAVNTPMELIKLQLQVRGTAEGGYRNASHALASILRTAGPRALYLGFGVNVVRETVFASSYFSIYEAGASVLSGALAVPMAAAVPVAGGAAGIAAWLAALPVDSVKTIIQSQDMRVPRKLTPAGVAAHIWRVQGPAGFMRGALPSVVRAFIVNAVRISVYESVLSALKRSRGACADNTTRDCPSLVCRYVFNTCRV